MSKEFYLEQKNVYNCLKEIHKLIEDDNKFDSSIFDTDMNVIDLLDKLIIYSECNEGEKDELRTIKRKIKEARMYLESLMGALFI